jgi:hypothetical protein
LKPIGDYQESTTIESYNRQPVQYVTWNGKASSFPIQNNHGLISTSIALLY